MSEMIQAPANGTDTGAPAPLFVPRIDVLEEPARFVVLADMPGCDPASIAVQFEQGTLTIAGRVPERSHAGALRHREYAVGDFARRFNVTDAIDVERITAEYADGVLTLGLPKLEAARPRSIQVKVT